MQPQVTAALLTCVYMVKLKAETEPDLQARIAEALGGRYETPADLKRDLHKRAGVEISRVSAHKWLKGPVKQLKPVNADALGKLTGYNPTWLAAGIGPKKLGSKDTTRAEFTADELNIFKIYAKLPKDVKFQLASLISTLGAAHSERYATWSREEQQRAQSRDSASVS